MKNLAYILPCFALATAANAATIEINFDTADDFTNNFRIIRGTVGSNIGYGTTSGGNGYMWGGMLNNSQKVVAAYDTTPGDTSDPAQTFGNSFTVEFKASVSNAANVIGIYLFDPTNPNNNLSARVSVNQNGSADYFTFGYDGNIANGSSGTAFEEKGDGATGIIGTGGYFVNATTYRASTPLANSSEGSNVFHPLTITYTYGNNNDTALTFAYGDGSSYSATVIIPNEHRIENPALAFYMDQYTLNQTAKIDDIVITYTIPEPSTYGLIIGGVAGGLMMLRRKRRA